MKRFNNKTTTLIFILGVLLICLSILLFLDRFSSISGIFRLDMALTSIIRFFIPEDNSVTNQDNFVTVIYLIITFVILLTGLGVVIGVSIYKTVKFVKKYTEIKYSQEDEDVYAKLYCKDIDNSDDEVINQYRRKKVTEDE